MICLYPAGAIGIRSFRALPGAAFAQPRCVARALHGMKVGCWEYRTIDGRLVKLTHWEYSYP